MKLLILCLLVAALVCFLLYAFGRPDPNPGSRRVLGLGFGFWVIAEMVSRFLSSIPIILIACLMLGGCSSCSTTTKDAATNERNAGINAAGSAALKDAGNVLGSVIASSLLNLAQQEMGGKQQNIDLAHSAASSVWSVVGSQNIDIGAGIGHAISAFSAGKLKQTALEAETAAKNAQANGQPPAAITNAIASVISTAAGAPPAK